MVVVTGPRGSTATTRVWFAPRVAVRAVVAVLACWLALALAGEGRAADLLIRDARIIDGSGGPVRPHQAILIRGGRIAAIGPSLDASGVQVLDVRGATVLPGLVDAHVHLAVVPGMAFRDDGPETLERLRKAHLRAYLACGVTTVLDTGISLDLAREIRGWLETGTPGPTFLTLGVGFTAPGGYLAGFHAAPARGEDVAEHLDRLAAAGVVGVKVFIEPGFGPRATWPIPSLDVRQAIVRGAAARGLPIFVHANREDAKSIALDMGARAILHAGFYDESPSDAFVERMAASGAYLVTTFAIMDAELTRFHPERLDGPLVRRTVPGDELATARAPDAGRLLARAEIGFVAPWLPGVLRDAIAGVILRESGIVSRLASAQRAVQRLAAAGVPIVIGTDAGNWDIVPYQFHGPSTIREIELLGEAGLSPATALAAATSAPARMLGLESEIGTVEIGRRGDLVIVGHDPQRSLRALRKVSWTVKEGVARTPHGWLHDPG
jgi:imidazolonepropionase-like amidohydrolase